MTYPCGPIRVRNDASPRQPLRDSGMIRSMSLAESMDTDIAASELARGLRRVSVDTSLGEMSILDYGGHGADTVMFHAAGFCADSLSLVAAAMGGACRVFSVELPGHGQSPTGGVSPQAFWRVIPEIVAGLGTTRPVLVGFDLSGFFVTAAAAMNPELASAVVSVGGWCLRTREETAEFLEFLTGDDVLAGLADRMQLGASASDADGMQVILRTLARNSIHDFLIADEESRFADKIACTVQVMNDGTHVRLPTLDTMRMLHDLSTDDRVYPENALLERIAVPYKFVLTTDGIDQDLIERGHEISERLKNVHVSLVQAGNNPQMSHPEPIGKAIARVVTRLG